MLLGLHVQAGSLSIVSYLYLLQERDYFRLEQTFSSVTCRSRPPFLPPNESSHRPTARNSQVATASFLKIILGYSLGGLLLLLLRSDLLGRMWKLPESLENEFVRPVETETPGWIPLGATWHASSSNLQGKHGHDQRIERFRVAC